MDAETKKSSGVECINRKIVSFCWQVIKKGH